MTSQTPATKQKKSKTCRCRQSYRPKNKNGTQGTEKGSHRGTEHHRKKKQADPPPASEAPSADPPAVDEPNKNVLTTTQWLSVISIVVSLAGIYYKREEIKALLKKPPQDYTPPPLPPNSPVDFAPKEASNQWIELSFCFNIWKSKDSCLGFSPHMGRSVF